MTNTLAVILGALILLGLAADFAWFGSEHLVYLAKKLSSLIEWVAFWR